MQILMRLKKWMKLRFIIRHVFSGHMSYVTLFQCSLERSCNADLTVIEKKKMHKAKIYSYICFKGQMKG